MATRSLCHIHNRVTGVVNYKFTDIFEDPYDTFDLVPGSFDITGTPYKITGSWSDNIDKMVTIQK